MCRPKNIFIVKSAVAFLFILFSGCSTHQQPGDVYHIPAPKTMEQSDYRLQMGDQIRVSVYDEPDLSGTFDINSKGTVSLPLIGRMILVGLTIEQAEEYIAGLYNQGFLNSPKVSIDVLTLRPIYVMGEVKSPGEYPYSLGMSVLSAIASAGGFTYRADKDDITIKRLSKNENIHNQDEWKQIKASANAPVHPGDVITVDERLF